MHSVDGGNGLVDVEAVLVAPWPLRDTGPVARVVDGVRRDVRRMGGREVRHVRLDVRALERPDPLAMPPSEPLPVAAVLAPGDRTARPRAARRSVAVPSPTESLLVLLLALALVLVAALAFVELVALAAGAGPALVPRTRMGIALLGDTWDTAWVVAAGVGAVIAGLVLLVAALWPRRPRSLATDLRSGPVPVDLRRASVEETVGRVVEHDVPAVVDARVRATAKRARVVASLVRGAGPDAPVDVESRARAVLQELGLGRLPVQVKVRPSKQRAR